MTKMPYVPPPNDLGWGFAAFYIMAATLARSTETTNATIMASRLKLLSESYRDNILPSTRVVRLAPLRTRGPLLPSRAMEQPDLPLVRPEGTAGPVPDDMGGL